KLRPPLDVVSLWGMGLASGADIRHFFQATRQWRSAFYAAGRLARHGVDLLRHRRGMQLVNGNALVARLLRSAIDLDVQLIDSAPVKELLTAKGRVTGARINSVGGEFLVEACRG